MNEMFPIACGLIAGLALGGLMPRRRLVPGILAAVVLGTMATVISGEYLIGWEFLLIDIPLVAMSSVVGIRVSQMTRARLVDGVARRT